MELLLEDYSLAGLRKHVAGKQGKTKQKLYIYCNSLFSDTLVQRTSKKHLQETHSVPPVTKTQIWKPKLHQEASSGSTVQTYFLEANGDHILL